MAKDSPPIWIGILLGSAIMQLVRARCLNYAKINLWRKQTWTSYTL